ncbi:MAG TPA: hypothetical protein VMF91_24695 [Bryobacteraceae bacterium]|nr:hypothetical protein [Bryobacteraceae bacterium]
MEKERQHWNPEFSGVVNFDPSYTFLPVPSVYGIWNPAITMSYEYNHPIAAADFIFTVADRRPPRSGPKSVIYRSPPESSRYATNGIRVFS